MAMSKQNKLFFVVKTLSFLVFGISVLFLLMWRLEGNWEAKKLAKELKNVPHPHDSTLIRKRAVIGCFRGNGTKCDVDAAELRTTKLSRYQIESHYRNIEQKSHWHPLMSPYPICWNEECSSEFLKSNFKREYSPIYQESWMEVASLKNENYYIVMMSDIFRGGLDFRCCM